MPKVSPLQSDFSGGEISPLVRGRVDTELYGRSLATCKNFIPTEQGALTRRTGTKYVAEKKDTGDRGRLLPYVVDADTTIIVEVDYTSAKFRFFKNGAPILSGGSPYEVAQTVATTEAATRALQWAQVDTDLFIVSGAASPCRLRRVSDASWQCETLWGVPTSEARDGPYQPNTTSILLTPSATGGAVTFTASASLFTSGDVYRSLRFRNRVFVIASYTSATQVTANLSYGSALPDTSGSTSWQLGLFHSTCGWPATVSEHDGRLFYGGHPLYPARIDGSSLTAKSLISSSYLNFEPSAVDTGTVSASSAVSYTLNVGRPFTGRWMESDERGLMAGFSGLENLVGPGEEGALSPTSVSAKNVSSYGSHSTRAVRADKSLLFLQRGGRKLRELTFDYRVEGHIAEDLAAQAEHLTRGGLVDLVWQPEPQPTVWAVGADGTLIGVTYRKSGSGTRVGWHKHVIGGVSDAGGTQAVVESLAVGSSAGQDQLWMIVKRRINGSTKRYVEYVTPFFDGSIAQEDAIFVDSAVTYDGSAATSITGLSHLEGQTVAVYADGAARPNAAVSSGAITISPAANVVQVGLPFTSDAELLPFEAGSGDGTAVGKTRRTHRLNFLLDRTLGVKVGMSFTGRLTAMNFRRGGDASTNVPLFTGLKTVELDADYDTENAICIRVDQPVPCTILAVGPQMVTQDR